MTAASSSNSGQLTRKVQTVATISTASALAVVVTFVVSVLSARVLGPVGRGEVATVLQSTYIVVPFVGSGTDRLLPHHDDYGHGLVPSGFTITMVALVARTTADVIYGPWTTIVDVVALVIVSFSMVRAMTIGRHQVFFFVAVFVGFQGSILLISTTLYFAGVEDWRWQATTYIFPTLSLAIWSLAKPRKHTDSRVGKVVETVRTNAPSIISGLEPPTTTCLDCVLLPALTPPASLGLPVIVATAAEPLYWIVQSVADQRISDQRGRELTPSHVLRHLGIVTAAYNVLGTLDGMASYFLIVSVFGHEFEPARELMLPLTTAVAVLGCYRHLCGEIPSSDNPRQVDRVELISTIIVIACYPIGILLKNALGLTRTSVVVYFAATTVAAMALIQPNGGPKNPSITNEELPVDAIEEN